MLKIHNNPPRREWPALTARCTRQEGEITERVAAILSQVRTGGDKALRDLVARIEGYVPERFEVSRRQRTEAAKAVPQRLKTALAIAKSNIEAFHRAQLPPQVDIEVMPGVRCVQRAVAIGRVGLYVPGGNAPLFSTVLMLALPARIAGCGEVILCTPAGRGGKIAPEVLFAADLCGVDRIFAVGGAQAVAAMAYGTESIPHVEKIFGPGNRYVTRAKQLVSTEAVAVDLPAGPSEVMVLADNSARAEFVAADLLSQAEHGDDSQAILVCRTERFARQVTRAVEEQIRYLSRGEAIRNSIVRRGIQADCVRQRLCPGAPDRLDARRMGHRRQDHGRGQRLHRQLLARKRRGLRLGHQSHAAHGRLGPCLQRGERRQFHAQDHIPGADARRARRAGARNHGHGRGRRARRTRQRRARPDERRDTMKPLSQLVRPNILALQPYSTARDEYAGGGIDVWLDANESPYDNGVNRYPDPHQRALKALIAELKDVDAGRIFLGNGSDEAIDLAFRIFCRPGLDNAVSIAPTYGMYRVAAATNDVQMREVPLGAGYSLPVGALLAAADERTKLIWLCSPNNPTGNAFPAQEIESLLRRFDGIVVLDEAYIDFADGGGFLPRLGEFPNLIVLQTLSKAWGMAGLRLGLAFASEEIAGLFGRVKYPYNINTLTQRAVAESLRRDISAQVAAIRAERSRLAAALAACPCIGQVYPSEGNFLLVKTAAPDPLYRELVAAGVIVRNRSRIAGCEGCLRITVGRPEENDRMLETVKNFRP